MTEQSWKPLFRTPTSTITKVLKSPAFLHARRRAAATVDSAEELRALADAVELLDHVEAPLSAVADRVFAAVRFLRSTADAVEAAQVGDDEPTPDAADAAGPTASSAARARLLVAGLHYLVTPDDLVPDFRAGGYIDDVLLLSWVFGAAVHELEPYLPEDPPEDPGVV
jgi:hypothetical protein